MEPVGTLFSTYVEVFPCRTASPRIIEALLHIRGGVSQKQHRSPMRTFSSPHTWRCFPSDRRSGPYQGLFSTYVEVFPRKTCQPSVIRSLLHIRGGVSGIVRKASTLDTSSLHTWRCFSIPYVQLLSRHTLLHIRGGVSDSDVSVQAARRSSPHTWRCFCTYIRHVKLYKLFSTYVEVFPQSSTSRTLTPTLLHIRGDVSVIGFAADGSPLSSPHTWRCFQ